MQHRRKSSISSLFFDTLPSLHLRFFYELLLNLHSRGEVSGGGWELLGHDLRTLFQLFGGWIGDLSLLPPCILLLTILDSYTL